MNKTAVLGSTKLVKTMINAHSDIISLPKFLVICFIDMMETVNLLKFIACCPDFLCVTDWKILSEMVQLICQCLRHIEN